MPRYVACFLLIVLIKALLHQLSSRKMLSRLCKRNKKAVTRIDIMVEKKTMLFCFVQLLWLPSYVRHFCWLAVQSNKDGPIQFYKKEKAIVQLHDSVVGVAYTQVGLLLYMKQAWGTSLRPQYHPSDQFAKLHKSGVGKQTYLVSYLDDFFALSRQRCMSNWM